MITSGVVLFLLAAFFSFFVVHLDTVKSNQIMWCTTLYAGSYLPRVLARAPRNETRVGFIK